MYCVTSNANKANMIERIPASYDHFAAARLSIHHLVIRRLSGSQ